MIGSNCHLSVTLYVVAKRYILQQNCLNKWIGSALLGTRRYNFQFQNRPFSTPKISREQCESFIVLLVWIWFGVVVIVNEYPASPYIRLYHTQRYKRKQYERLYQQQLQVFLLHHIEAVAWMIQCIEGSNVIMHRTIIIIIIIIIIWNIF